MSLQFLIRPAPDGNNYLHTFANLRSSDAWLGIPYDWFTFSMVSAYIVIYLKRLGYNKLKLGKLHLYAASEHLYKAGFGYSLNDVLPAILTRETEFDYKPLNIDEFEKPDQLTWHLKSMAESNIGLGYTTWLNELTAYITERDLKNE